MQTYGVKYRNISKNLIFFRRYDTIQYIDIENDISIYRIITSSQSLVFESRYGFFAHLVVCAVFIVVYKDECGHMC